MAGPAVMKQDQAPCPLWEQGAGHLVWAVAAVIQESVVAPPQWAHSLSLNLNTTGARSPSCHHYLSITMGVSVWA